MPPTVVLEITKAVQEQIAERKARNGVNNMAAEVGALDCTCLETPGKLRGKSGHSGANNETSNPIRRNLSLFTDTHFSKTLDNDTDWGFFQGRVPCDGADPGGCLEILFGILTQFMILHSLGMQKYSDSLALYLYCKSGLDRSVALSVLFRALVFGFTDVRLKWVNTSYDNYANSAKAPANNCRRNTSCGWNNTGYLREGYESTEMCYQCIDHSDPEIAWTELSGWYQVHDNHKAEEEANKWDGVVRLRYRQLEQRFRSINWKQKARSLCEALSKTVSEQGEIKQQLLKETVNSSILAANPLDKYNPKSILSGTEALTLNSMRIGFTFDPDCQMCKDVTEELKRADVGARMTADRDDFLMKKRNARVYHEQASPESKRVSHSW